MKKILKRNNKKVKFGIVETSAQQVEDERIFDIDKPYRNMYDDDYLYTDDNLTAQEAYERDLQDYEEDRQKYGSNQSGLDIREINIMIDYVYSCIVKVNMDIKEIRAFVYGTAMGSNVDKEFADYVYEEIVKRIQADMHEVGKEVVKKEQTIYEFSQK